MLIISMPSVRNILGVSALECLKINPPKSPLDVFLFIPQMNSVLYSKSLLSTCDKTGKDKEIDRIKIDRNLFNTIWNLILITKLRGRFSFDNNFELLKTKNMPIIHSKYTGGLRCESTHLRSGQKLITDAPVDNHGKGEAFSPTDLLCCSLATCMMTTMGIKAQNYGLKLTGLSAEVEKYMASSPRKVAKAVVKLKWENPVEDVEIVEVLKVTALTCPVALSLSEHLEQEVIFEF